LKGGRVKEALILPLYYFRYFTRLSFFRKI
jgi:hypothetical protein